MGIYGQEKRTWRNLSEDRRLWGTQRNGMELCYLVSERKASVRGRRRGWMEAGTEDWSLDEGDLVLPLGTGTAHGVAM